MQHQPDVAEDRDRNRAEALRSSGRNSSQRQIVRTYPGALRASRQSRTRSRIGLPDRAILQGFRAGGREARRYRQGEAQENQYRAGNFADSIRTKCFKGKERILGGRRSQGRSGGLLDKQMASVIAAGKAEDKDGRFVIPMSNS